MSVTCPHCGAVASYGYEPAHRTDCPTLRNDPRNPRPDGVGIFRDHNCWKCSDGAKPCVRGATSRCEFPHARND